MATKKSNPVLSQAEREDLEARMRKHVCYTLERMEHEFTNDETAEIVNAVTWGAIDWAQSLEIE